MVKSSHRVAIKVEHVSKDFRLPHESKRSIKGAFLNIFRSKHTRDIETQHALKDISFEVEQGEFFGILGRNGSGKSTLLKILAEIYRPTKGAVHVNGRLVPFIELGVGFNPELTGRENVYLSGALSGFSREEMDAMYDDIVNFAELEAFMDQKLKNYSSGMQVRLAFSVATRAKADILLIDEVLAVGDADFQRKCFDYFKSLKKKGVTVVFVSHDMNAVREYCDRAILIEKSELIEGGTSDKVAGTYTRLFTPNTDEADGDSSSVRTGDGRIRFEDVAKVSPVDDKTEMLTVSAKAKVNENIDSPIFGFTVRDAEGRAVCGTNTAIIKAQTASYTKNATVNIEWRIPNVFSNGRHEIDLAIVGHDGFTTHDWWEGAVNFRVEKESNTPYVTSPQVSVTVK